MVIDLWVALDLGFVVQNGVQQRAIDLDLSVVVDQAELAKLVHKETDAGSGRSDHLGQRFLADVRAD